MPNILGLDASSTMIGYCLLDGERVEHKDETPTAELGPLFNLEAA